MTSPLSSAATASAGLVLGVLVVYGRRLDGVDGWPMLQRLLEPSAAPGALQLAGLLVYDNSPEPLAASAQEVPGCRYVHDPSNGGTAAAYRRATEHAAALGVEWLLLLDHDTTLPTDYLAAVQAALERHAPRVPAALLPRVRDGDTVVSPSRISCTGSFQPWSDVTAPASRDRLTGLASGSLVRVDAMQRIGPLPPELWLDYVDHWLFAQIRRSGGSIATVDAELQHHLSVQTPHRLGRRRLHSILDGEKRFVRLLPWPARVLYPARLALRFLRRLRHPASALDMLAWFGRRRGASR